MMQPSFPRRYSPRVRHRGFTLTEAVIAIVITAIIVAAVAIFIRLPVSGYIESAARADLADTGDTTLRRMARDLRLALPNSVRVTTDATGAYYIEFLLTRTGGRYLSVDDNPTSGNVLDYLNGSLKFDFIGPIPVNAQAIQVGDSVVVYNLGQGIAPSDAYLTSGNSNRAQIAGISGNTITLVSNPYTSQSPKRPSPYNRFQVIVGPVTYRCDPTAQTMTRYWNYPIVTTQPNSVAALAGGQNALITTGVTTCSFVYQSTNSLSSALVTLTLGLTTPNNSSGGNVSLFEQVHVDNTP